MHPASAEDKAIQSLILFVEDVKKLYLDED